MSTPIHWPADDLQEWSVAADEFAQGRLSAASLGHEHHADPAFKHLLDELREMGFLALCADERLDGLGQGASALARVLEAVCAVDASAGAAIYTSAAAHLALRACHLPDTLVRSLPDLAGNWLAWPAFHELHEQPWPELSSDGRLSGCVEMLLLGAHARWAVTPARDASLAHGPLRLVLVDLTHPTVARGAPVRTLGLSACGLADVGLSYTPCHVVATEAQTLIGQIESALTAGAVAMQCGVMRGSLHGAQSYAAERVQGGGNLLGWGEVRRLLSLMHERLTVAQGLLGQLLVPDHAGLAAQYSALHVGSLACEQTTDGVQLLGGNGYMKDYGQEKRMRDARQLQGLLGGVAWRRQRCLARAVQS
jgi:alkylation response protein AidB-like acyl-CoA dehydrogenase